MAIFHTPFGLHDRVLIDGDETIVAIVVQVCWGDNGASTQVSWFSSGAMQTVWVSDRRLTAAPSHLVKPRVPEESRP